MIDALYIAATGMQSEQTHIDTISNNLANLNTVGFKKSQIRFDDLIYQDSLAATADASAANSSVGMGSSVSAITKIFSDGDLKPTDNPLDVAISGSGFFEIELENGEMAYTRNGNFEVNEDGFLASSGYVLADRVQLPPDVSELIVDKDGSVQVRLDGGDDLVEIGEIGLSYFLNDAGLSNSGGGVYLPTDKSGPALYSKAGKDGVGSLEQKFIESSNVDLIEELINLTVAQRGFEVNSQVIRASDQIMQIINNLRQ